MIKHAITWAEKGFLVIIALFTFFAMFQEVVKIITHGNVELKDLLLMFIFAEVLGMLGAFYSSHKIPITIPLFIAITALSRLIILQGKDSDPSLMLYESAAILMISLACVAIGYHQRAAEQLGKNPDDAEEREPPSTGHSAHSDI